MSDRLRLHLIRTVRFSSGHRYWNSDLNLERNREKFGIYASPYNHGHNYVLDVVVSGVVDDRTGMVVNIKRLDDFLQSRIVSAFDFKSLNDEILEFQSQSPTLENFLLVIRDRVTDSSLNLNLPSGFENDTEVKLESLKLYEMPDFWATWTPQKMTLTRTYEFAAAHRLHVPSLSASENLSLFGKCNNVNGHGHNYIVEVSVEGEVNPETGMMTDLLALDKAVTDLIVDRYDHKFLDKDLPEFIGKPTTTEAVTQEIFNRLENHLPAKLSSVRLYETARSAFEVKASG